MGGNRSRSRGKRGESLARLLLSERDYDVDDLTDGTSCADFIAVKHGRVYAVEVKCHKSINLPEFLSQARKQAGRKRWMLLAKLEGYRAFLVIASDIPPTVWRLKD